MNIKENLLESLIDTLYELIPCISKLSRVEPSKEMKSKFLVSGKNLHFLKNPPSNGDSGAQV